MKKLLIVITAFVLVSCEDNVERRTIKDKYYGQEMEVFIADSCEYIKIKSISAFSHKGNCKFCKERLNK